jgi:NAD-dependent deacetylase
MKLSLEELGALFLAASQGNLLVVTGAGISLASGIPTFRGTDPDAVWAKDVTELGTFRYFREDPAGSWSWYLSRFDAVSDADPNPAHHALVALERWQLEQGGQFLLVTQNVDTLHAKAGSQELVEVHGRADRVRCATEGCPLGSPGGWLPRAEVDLDAFRADPRLETVPRCPTCGDFLRQHVLWFDEVYQGHEDYQWERVIEGAHSAHLVVMIGTSCSVGVTELFLQAALARRVPVLLLDPGPSQGLPVLHVQAKAEVFLPSLARHLGALSDE